MNTFVRDGAVNRRKRFRQSFSTHNTEQEKKKIHKTHGDGTKAQSDFALSTFRPNFDESTADQSTVVATQKESRYQNSEFMRSKAFLYLNYKKINSGNVNKSLKEYLKQYDGNETHLRRIFEQCYDVSKGSVEKSKAMMKQIETNAHVRLDLLPNSFSGVRSRLPMSSCKVVQKTVKKCDNKKYKKKLSLLLKQRIDDKNLILFGKYNSKKDKKILYGKTIIPVIIPKIDENYDTASPVSEHFESENNCYRITKSCSLYSKQNNSLRVTKVSKPSSDRIVPRNSISCKNNLIRCYGKIIVPQLKMDVSAYNSQESMLKIVHDVEKIMIPQIKIDETVQDAQGSALKTNIVVEEIMIPQLKIDKTVQDAESFALKTNIVEEIMIPQLKIDKTVQDAESFALKTNIVEEIMIPQLKIDKTIQDAQGSALKTNIVVEEIMIPQLKIDKTVQDAESFALKTNIVEEIMIPQLKIDKTIQDTEGSALKIVHDVEKIMIPPIKMDKIVQNAKESALKTNIVEEVMIPQLKMDGIVQNSNEFSLKTNIDVGRNIIPQLKTYGIVQNVKEAALKIDENSTVPQLPMDECVKNVKDSALEIVTDCEEIIIPQLKMEGNNENTKIYASDTNIDVGEIIDLESEKYIITSNTIDSQVNKIENVNTNDMNQQSEILNYDVNIVIKIGNLIDPEDKVFKNSIVKDLATYFLNDDFLHKVHALWKTTESDLVGELVVKLLTMFNDIEYNMALFSGCLISIFREIARKSSIPPCKIKLKLIMFLDAIKKYIKFHDYELWRNWFLPSMFFDWCFIVAYTFMNTDNDFMIDLNKKSIIINATTYYKMVKQCKYFFINQDSKPIKSLKKKGIFELTRIDDLLEIDDLHSVQSDNTVIPNTSINISSTEPKHKKPKIDDCIETINHTVQESLEEVCPTPVNPRIYVNPKYNISNSFIKTLNWFNSDVTELRNKLNAVIFNECIDSSIVVQNNVDDNILPLDDKLGSVVTSETNKPIKRKKSCTQVESPRVFFTIANDPKEFNITCGSSMVTQNPSSSAVPQNANLSKVPQNSSSLPICQSSSTSPICRNSSLSPQNSSLSTILANNPKELYITYDSSVVTQNPSSPTVPQNASLSKVPQNLSSSTILANNLKEFNITYSSSKVLRNSRSSKVPRNSSSSTVLPYGSSTTILQNSSFSVAPINLNQHYNNILSNNTQFTATLETVITRTSNSSTVPQNSGSSSVSQNSSLSTVPKNICPCYNNHLINTQFPETMQTVIPQTLNSSTVSQNLSSYYNNISSNYTHISNSNQNSLSISNVTQTSNSRSTHLPVDINAQSSITTLPPVSLNKWPSNFYQQSTTTNSQHLKAVNTWPSNLYHQSTATNSQPLKAANTWPSNLYQQSTATNVQTPKATNTFQTNLTNTKNVYKNPCHDPSCCAHFKLYTDSAPSYLQSPYKENIPLTTTHPQLSNACTYSTNNIQPISREVVGRTAASVTSINNAYTQKLNEKYNNYNYGNSLVNHYGLQSSEHNHQCMAANCTNISCFRCDSCMAAFYCGTQCQKSDWHYHKNECRRF
ncbi:uncharacterized protein LOC113560956 isoform X2 [Rhopalosiphum maidis]|uniref:uncharacterized protein LOC113560956 isoform X2 n=1 Tax=Rhopalosiphum maidis TaxID=43146 RepID=UPI000EFF464E|nr:uncharacterized protein LOC113560956 isoform X2 [Rhopalosiphum maidis]